MRKLITILLLLISTYSYGQAVLSGSKGWDGYIDSGADSLITRMETATSKTMTNAGKEIISNMFVMFKDSLSITSLQNFFDVLYFLDIGVETAGKLNWIKDAHNITNVNSVVFDTVGAAGNGSTSYLNTNYNPNTQGVNISLNNTAIAVYIKVIGTTNKIYTGGATSYGEIGTGDGTWLWSSTSGVAYSGLYISGGNTPTYNSGVTGTLGLIVMNRIDTTGCGMFKNADSLAKVNHYSSAITNRDILICSGTKIFGELLNPSDGTISVQYISKSYLKETQRKIYNIIKYWQNNKNSITFFNE